MSAENMAMPTRNTGPYEYHRDVVPSLTATPCLLRNAEGTRPGIIFAKIAGMMTADFSMAMYVYRNHTWEYVTPDEKFAVLWPETKLNGGA